MRRVKVRKIMLLILFIFVVILPSCVKSVFADTRYVSDVLIISVRDGQNKDDNVLGYIKTGTPVEVLEEKDRYLRIKTGDGLEGWVQTQYIILEKPKALIIEDLRNEINDLNKKVELSKNEPGFSSDIVLDTKKIYEEKIRKLEQEVKKNQNIAANARIELVQLNKKYKNILRNSKNTDQLNREYEKLKKENAELKTENAELKTETNNLRKPSKGFLKSIYIQWFVAGAGALLFGFIIGRLAGRKKRASLY